MNMEIKKLEAVHRYCNALLGGGGFQDLLFSVT